MAYIRITTLFVIVLIVAGMTWVSDVGAGLSAETPTPVAEEEANEPDEEAWWPSQWGEDDEIGATHLITPGKVMAATQLIQEGKIYELGRQYDAQMPIFGERVYALRIPGSPTVGPVGSNGLIVHDDFLTAEIGQVGTQFDGLGHIGLHLGEPGDKSEMRYYNGVTELEMAGLGGLQKLGVENVKPIFTRGVLIDIAGLKERMLDVGEEIMLVDVLDALERQGMSEDDIQPGDAVLFNTGWGSLWKVDNERFSSGAPGIGLEVAAWLIEKQVVLAGSDTWPLEVVPNPNPELVFPVHVELITKNGIHIQENLDFAQVLEDEVYQFAYIYVRVPLAGATGSPGSPIAVR